MSPIIFLVIAVGIGSAIVGSMAIQFFAQANNAPQQLDLEEKCEKIASEGFKIQVKYSEIDFDKMPKEDADALRYLDDLWIRDCASQLSPETIYNIAKRVEQDYYSGE
ncbi:MAG: hypothetical protein PVG43_01220 [Nitrosopumilaceae archaeon]